MSDVPMWGRYTELHPDQIATIVDAAPVAYLPWGSLAWHGTHLPFGTAGLTAEAVSKRAVRRTGGVLLPTTWWPVTPLPHRFSISIRSEVIQALWDDLFAELARMGFRVVVLLNGHCSPGQELVLMDAAEHAIAVHRLLVLSVPPLALVDERMLDHAAHWETALLMALRPELVALDTLGSGQLSLSAHAVLGTDPRGATPTQGENVLALATERIVVCVHDLLTRGSPDALRELYTRRRAVYQDYVKRYYRGSWEEALLLWWHDQALAQDDRDPGQKAG